MMYLEKTRTRRRVQKKDPSLFKRDCSTADYIARFRTAGLEYGQHRHGQAQGLARQYGSRVWDLVRDERTLYAAHRKSKGTAPGEDGVAPHQLHRYALYRRWLDYCGIKRQDWPAFKSTVFYHAEHYLLCGMDLTLGGGNHYMSATFHWGGRDPRRVHRLRIGIARQDQMSVERAGKDIAKLEELRRAVEQSLCTDAYSDPKTEPLLIPGLRYLRPPLQRLMNLGDDDDEVDTTKSLNYMAARWLGKLLEPEEGGRFAYRPGPLRPLAIPKAGGGTRTLRLANVTDRVIERAALMVVEPMLERIFVPSSVGCRMEMDRFQALASLRRLYPQAQGKWVLCADIKAAFDNVPHEPLLRTVHDYLPPDECLQRFFLLSIKRPGCRPPGMSDDRGIPQGSPLSPMLLNLLLHHHLDVPYLKQKPKPLAYVRYVDDLLVFGFRSRREGERELERLASLLAPLGLDLHRDPPKTQIVHLAADVLDFDKRSLDGEHEGMFALADDEQGEVDRYLGLGLRAGRDGELAFYMPRDWRERVSSMFERAVATARRLGYHGSESADRHFVKAAKGWLDAFGPAHPSLPEADVAAAVVAALEKHNNGASPFAKDEALEWWREAQRRWECLCGKPTLPELTGARI